MKTVLGQDKTKLRPQEPPYTSCMDMDFSWSRREVCETIRLWRLGVPYHHIAERINRDPDEVFILLIDLGRRKKIKKRPGGVFGCA